MHSFETRIHTELRKTKFFFPLSLPWFIFNTSLYSSVFVGWKVSHMESDTQSRISPHAPRAWESINNDSLSFPHIGWNLLDSQLFPITLEFSEALLHIFSLQWKKHRRAALIKPSQKFPGKQKNAFCVFHSDCPISLPFPHPFQAILIFLFRASGFCCCEKLLVVGRLAFVFSLSNPQGPLCLSLKRHLRVGVK